jgi:hypothetical protein
MNKMSIILFFFPMVLGFELRALHFLDRCTSIKHNYSTTLKPQFLHLQNRDHSKPFLRGLDAS